MKVPSRGVRRLHDRLLEARNFWISAPRKIELGLARERERLVESQILRIFHFF